MALSSPCSVTGPLPDESPAHQDLGRFVVRTVAGIGFQLVTPDDAL